jgi:hypothetical protein
MVVDNMRTAFGSMPAARRLYVLPDRAGAGGMMGGPMRHRHLEKMPTRLRNARQMQRSQFLHAQSETSEKAPGKTAMRLKIVSAMSQKTDALRAKGRDFAAWLGLVPKQR